MQLKLSFASLLAGVLLAFTAQDAEARPLVNRNPGLVTLPLKRVPQRTDLHPTILLQQHINRSNRRLARFTGRQEPSELELRQHIERRVAALEDPTLAKRFNRSGLKGTKDKRFNNRIGLAGSSTAHSFRKGRGRGGNGGAAAAGAGGAAVGAGAAGAAGAANGAGGATGAANGAGGATGAANGANGAAASGNGAASAAAADAVEKANTPTADNSLGLDIEGDDVGYLATIQMGTPPQDFLILMDSGSADLWVGSENCVSVDSGGGCGNHQFLGTQSSSSFQDSGNPFQVTYGTGAVAGTIIQDDIVVAGLQLKAHTFGVADQETDDFASDQTPFDGLMGLAQSTLSEQKTLTPIEALAKQGLVQSAITSFKISRAADNLNDGEITFGGVDQTKFDAQTLTTFANVNQQGFWEGAMDAVTVDGQDTGLQGRTAILDTGTTLIVAPPDDAAAVHQLIQGSASDGQGGFTVPCNLNQSVALSFGGTSFAIDPRDIAFSPVDPNDPTGDCLSGISAGNVGGATEWLVGDVFLKNAYFSTDVNQNQISLAKLV
ncbi:acid protease [Dendrothele bispora CBS 962.96]|uniref:Acid protease n=1 Tax=Dendrothele bispora (strain CBS 962.96) TaxID=1314807 RepID=A0A4S8MJB2_DENBC|nr:acid protease [Dendrothele bispora CBS 962.96]